MSAPTRVMGPCTECRMPHDGCKGPVWCCDECLHLDETWEGYEDDGLTDRTTATDDEFIARLARIEAAPDADEAFVERMARAMCDGDYDYFGNVTWADSSSSVREDYRRLARVAVAVMRGRQP